MSGSSRRGDPSGKSTIVVDGEEYADVETMPPEVRRVYEETLGSLRRAGEQRSAGSHVVRTQDGLIVRSHDTRIKIGDETIDLAELPPQLREVVERHLAGALADTSARVEGPSKETRSHTVRIVHETRSGGSVLGKRRQRYSTWAILLLLVLSVGIFVLITLAA